MSPDLNADHTISTSKAGRAAAMARDGRLANAVAPTVAFPVQPDGGADVLASLAALETIASDAVTRLQQACAAARHVLAKATGGRS